MQMMGVKKSITKQKKTALIVKVSADGDDDEADDGVDILASDVGAIAWCTNLPQMTMKDFIGKLDEQAVERRVEAYSDGTKNYQQKLEIFSTFCREVRRLKQLEKAVHKSIKVMTANFLTAYQTECGNEDGSRLNHKQFMTDIEIHAGILKGLRKDGGARGSHGVAVHGAHVADGRPDVTMDDL